MQLLRLVLLMHLEVQIALQIKLELVLHQVLQSPMELLALGVQVPPLRRCRPTSSCAAPGRKHSDC